MRGDDRHAERHGLLHEGLPRLRDAPLVVQPPAIAVVQVQVGIVREHLPRLDRVLPDVLLHFFEVGVQRAHVRQHLGVKQDAFVVTQPLGHDPGLVHDPRRQRAPYGRDGQGREHDQVRVALQEDLAHEVLDVEADPGIGLATVLLGNRVQKSYPSPPWAAGFWSYSRR